MAGIAAGFVVAGALALPSAAGAAGPDLAHGGRLDGTQLGTGAALVFRDVARARPEGRAGAAAARAFSASAGGFFSTGDGYLVDIRGAGDNGAKASVALFLGSLVHGSEIARLRVLIVTPDQIAGLCGSDEAVACYGDDGQMVIPTEAPDADNELVEVVSHEYGHHIDLNRANPPWPEFNQAKIWYSQARICPALHSGTYANNYARGWGRDPSEFFAETNRLLNEHSYWRDDVYFPRPGAADLAALREDILTPWTKPTAQTLSGRLGRGNRSDALTIKTPLDGTLRLKLSFAHGRDFDLGLRHRGTRRFLRKATGQHRPERISYTICGTRSFVVKVSRTGGSGRYELQVTHP